MDPVWRQKLVCLLRGVPLEVYRTVKRIGQRLGRWLWTAIRVCLPASPQFGLAKGTFTAHLVGSSEGRAPGRVVLENQGAPALKPNSLMALSGLQQHQQQPWPIFWQHFPQARLRGSSLSLVNDRQQICLQSAYGQARFQTDPGYNHFVLGAPLHLSGNWTSLVSRWVPTATPSNFAHWLLDALPRLALLGEFPGDTRILVPKDLHPFQTATLEWLGLTDRCRRTAEKNLLLESYFFSSPVSMVVSYSPYAVEFLRKNFLRFADQEVRAPKRFFLRRTGPIRNIANEQEVLDFFAARGWAIVDAAQLSLAAQIQYFSQAEAICAIHGAGLTNCVWCQPGCQVIELLSASYLSGCFEWICEVVQAEHQYKVFPTDSLFNARINLAELGKLLEAAL